MKKPKKYLFPILTLLVILFVTTVSAAIPHTLSHNFRIKNATSGANINVSIDLSYNIYSASTGGTSLQEINMSVTPNNGIVSVHLPGITLPFDQPYFAGLKINGGSELSPRLNLTSSGYSFFANESYNMNWTGLKNYPDACTAGQYMTAVGDTLTCSTPPDGNSTEEIRAAVNVTDLVYNFTIKCENIQGSPDTDFCTDATTAGGGNSSEEMIAAVNVSTYTYVFNVSCGNVEGATSNLCTLTDTQGGNSTAEIQAAVNSSVTYIFSITGNAATATALAANGGNCAAGSYPLGVDASGAVEDCTDATTEIDSAIATHAGTAHGNSTAEIKAAIDGEYPNLDTDDTDDVTNNTDGLNLNITGNSATATALAANGANCNAGEYPLGVDASGAVESCTDATTEIQSEVSTHAATKHGNSTTEIQAVAVGGEVSGTVGSITLDDTALDDAYVELGDNFAGDVTGTYDATVVGDDTHQHACQNITGAASDLCTITDTTGGNSTQQIQDAINNTGSYNFLGVNSTSITSSSILTGSGDLIINASTGNVGINVDPSVSFHVSDSGSVQARFESTDGNAGIRFTPNGDDWGWDIEGGNDILIQYHDDTVFSVGQSGQVNASSFYDDGVLLTPNTDTTYNSDEIYIYESSETFYWNTTYADTIYLTEDELNTLGELNTQLTDAVLVDTGTMTDGKWCKYVSASTDIQCNVEPVVDTQGGNSTQEIRDAVNASVGYAFNAATATALESNGGNCAAGSYPLGVDASGAVEDCTDATTEIDSAIATHAATKHGNSTTEIQAVAVGGEASGTIGSITLDHDALDDQYYDSEADLTTLLDDNYLAAGTATGNSTAEIRTAINISAQYDFYASDLICTNCIDGTEISELTDADVSNTLTCSVLTDDDTYATTASAETFDEHITFSKNITVEAVHLENDAGHFIKNNATCIIIAGDTSTLNIC